MRGVRTLSTVLTVAAIVCLPLSTMAVQRTVLGELFGATW
jgi:hypothetical protein